jgi:hypothetical protein
MRSPTRAILRISGDAPEEIIDPLGQTVTGLEPEKARRLEKGREVLDHRLRRIG